MIWSAMERATRRRFRRGVAHRRTHWEYPSPTSMNAGTLMCMHACRQKLQGGGVYHVTSHAVTHMTYTLSYVHACSGYDERWSTTRGCGWVLTSAPMS